MDRKWKVKTSEVLLTTPHFEVRVDHCVDFAGQDRDYYKMNGPSNGYVMVVPVKISYDGNHSSAEKKVSYIMVEQYRHGCETVCLEFPAGRRDPGEASADAAARELMEETGYKAKHLKFVYSTHLSPVRSTDQQSVFLAVVEGEPDEPNYEPSEVGSGMKTVELTAAELHKKILDNEITSTCSLAALCATLLQSAEAIKYLDTGKAQI